MAFAFAGNGAQRALMGREELRRCPAFRRGVEEADAALRPHLPRGVSVLAILRRGATEAELARTDLAQPLLFAFQWGAVAALAEEGVRPVCVLGHSVGEVAAAACAGLLSLASAARLVAERSRHQHATRGAGRMAALSGVSAEGARALLAACSRRGEPPLEIAAVNGPEQLTVAGPEAAVERLAAEAEAARLAFARLPLDYAFHSRAMDPVRGALLAGLRGLRGREPRVPALSTVTGAPLGRADMGPAYWWRNLREPVRFDLAVAAAARDHAPALFLEVGPAPVLQGYLRASLRAAGSPANILGAPRAGGGGETGGGDPFAELADRATALGADPRGGPRFRAGRARWRGLPPCAEDAAPPAGEPLRPAASAEAVRHVDPPHDHPLLGFRTVALGGADPPGEWTRTLDAAEEPWLADHALRGAGPVLPAAAMAEMALAAAFLRHPRAPAAEALDLAILAPLPLGAPRQVRTRLADDGRWTLESRPRLSDEPWATHAEARVRPLPALRAAPPAPGPPANAPETPGEEVTAIAAALGLEYGPAFRAVRAVRADGDARARAALERPDSAPPDDGFHLHPSRADGALQALLPPLARGGDLHLPVRFARVVARRGAAPAVRADIALRARGERSAEADILLRDAAGEPVGALEGAAFHRVPGAASAPALAFRPERSPLPPPPGWPEATAAPNPLDALDWAALAAPPPARLAEAGLLAEAALAAAVQAAGDAAAPPLRATAEAFGELPGFAPLWRQAWEDAPEIAGDLAAVAALAEALAAGRGPGPTSPATAAPAPAAPWADGARRLGPRLVAAAASLCPDAADRPFRALLVGEHAAALEPALRAALPPWAEVAALPGWEPHGDPDTAGAPARLVLGLALSARAPAGRLAPALRSLAAPGGVVVLAEPAPGLFADAVAAVAAGEGGAAPPPPLADADGWRAALAAAGWEGARAAPLAAGAWGATLLAAAAPRGAAVLPAAPGRRFVLLAAPGEEALARALAGALAAATGGGGARPHAAVAPLAEPGPPPRELRGATLVALPGADASRLPALARLAAAAEGVAARLAVVADEESAAGAAALALARAIANEHPALRPLRLALAPELRGPAAAPAEAAGRVAACLLEEGGAEPEQRLGRDGRLAPRHLPGLPDAPSGPRRLAVARPGRLETLSWVAEADAGPAAPLGPGEVVLRAGACGLNFRDVMWAQGLLPEEALRHGFAGPGLGMEVAGTVLAAGRDTPFAPGDRVFGVAPRALATRCRTRAEALAPIPDGVSFEEAATLPVAFLTALYALEDCARVRPGERVLVHGGAGAVGLAALRVALAAGARVAATAGSPERRALLRAAGAEAAFDSRSALFADDVRALWPEGADVVLNSLSGEAMERSLGLVAPFGRFVELGKRDFAENRFAPIRPLRRNATYFAVDVDELARARPGEAARLLREVAARLADGRVRPLPREVHAASDAEGAFRALQRGGHIGKRVVLPPPESEGAAAGGAAWGHLPEPDRRPVVVVGGTSGFGLEAARWLAARAGARRIALLSRRGPGAPGAAEAVAGLAALGADAVALAADAADPASLGTALGAVRARWGGAAIGGVVHAAAVFRDGVAARLSDADWAEVWRAKAGAAEALDALTRADAPGLFLLFSSATVPVGAPGQGAYVAANAALEALARRRRAEGLPALAVQWGPVADAGQLAREAGDREALSRRLGAEALPAAELLDALPGLLASGLPVAGAARLRVGGGASLPVLAEPAMAALAARGGGGAAPDAGEDAAGAEALRARLAAAASRDEALALLREAVAGEVARVLRLPGGAGAVPPLAPLARLGLDSLGGIELRAALERRIGGPVAMPQGGTEGVTVDALARRLLEGVAAGVAAPKDAAGAAEAAPPAAPREAAE